MVTPDVAPQVAPSSGYPCCCVFPTCFTSFSPTWCTVSPVFCTVFTSFFRMIWLRLRLARLPHSYHCIHCHHHRDPFNVTPFPILLQHLGRMMQRFSPHPMRISGTLKSSGWLPHLPHAAHHPHHPILPHGACSAPSVTCRCCICSSTPLIR